MLDDAAQATGASEMRAQRSQSSDGRRLRKDAEHNRQRLLDAATEVFAERGLGATLHDVAAHAGVGVGTAYRNWANKNELIEELFRTRLDSVVELASDALQDPDGWAGFTSFLEQWLKLQLDDRGLTQIFNNPELGQARVSEARDQLAPLVSAIVDRAKATGPLRPEFEGTDVVFIQVALTALMDRTRNHAPDLYRRYLTMLLDGARTDRGHLSDLPAKALTVAETQAALTTPQ